MKKDRRKDNHDNSEGKECVGTLYNKTDGYIYCTNCEFKVESKRNEDILIKQM